MTNLAFSMKHRNEAFSACGLSDDDLRRVAPSVFSEAAHASRSQRYAHIPTIRVVEGLRGEGFVPVYAAQQRVLKPGMHEFTRHMLRLRHADHSRQQGDVVPELVLLNSHNGTSAYQMFAGAFRFICANGLILGTTTDDVRVRHSGDAVAEVIDGALLVRERFDALVDGAQGMRSVQLTEEARQAYAELALRLRFNVGDDQTAPVLASALLRPRRAGDSSHDLWTTFNVMQENLMRGGLLARNAAGRRTHTRAVQSINTSVDLNRSLWQLTLDTQEAVA